MDILIHIQREPLIELARAVNSSSSQAKGDKKGISFFLEPEEKKLTLMAGHPDQLQTFIFHEVETSLQAPCIFSMPKSYFLQALGALDDQRALTIKIKLEGEDVSFDVMCIPALLNHRADHACRDHEKAKYEQDGINVEYINKTQLGLLVQDMERHKPTGLIHYDPNTRRYKVQREDGAKKAVPSEHITIDSAITFDAADLPAIKALIAATPEESIGIKTLNDRLLLAGHERRLYLTYPSQATFMALPTPEHNSVVEFICYYEDLSLVIKGIKQHLASQEECYLFLDSTKVFIDATGPNDDWMFEIDTVIKSNRVKYAYKFNTNTFYATMPTTRNSQNKTEVLLRISESDEGTYSLALFTKGNNEFTPYQIAVYKEDTMLPTLISKKKVYEDKQKENKTIKKQRDKFFTKEAQQSLLDNIDGSVSDEV